MNKSSRSASRLQESATAYVASDLDLELPIDSDFDSRPSQPSPTQFIQWCEEMMELTPNNRDNPEQSFQKKAGLEFIM